MAPPAAGQDNEDCLGCHDLEGLEFEQGGRTRSLYVDPDRYDEGIHGVLDCIACHYELDGVEEYPHAKGLERVDCTDCHDDDDGPVAAYRGSVHGRLAEEGNELAPLCQDCHGYHGIVPLSDPDSMIAPHRVGQSCVQCHDEGQVVQRAYDLSDDEARTRFVDRIHLRGLFDQGLVVTATCTSCHMGHAVLPPDDPASTLHVDNVNGTCTQCHARVPEVHEDIVAADLWDAEPPLLCIDCHAPHAQVAVRTSAGLADSDCLSCHSSPEIVTGPERQSLAVSPAEHARSVHGRNGVSCAQCHAGVAPSADRACATITRPVRCDTCHAGEVSDYDFGVHGRLHAEDDENAPTCVDCHGTHGVLEHALDDSMSAEVRAVVRRSPTFPRNVPDLCGRCHRDGAPAAERYLGVQEHVLESYSMSIHGKGLLESGLTVTAVCSDCHTAHRELPAADPESTVHGSNVAATCGRCHDGISEVFETSAHSEAGNPDYVRKNGMPELPHCNDCHSSHGMARTDLPGFQLGIMDQCGTCHADITETYFETYHGKASALGDTARAKCHDCHGAHDIYANGDLRSNLHPANIVGTCATCHAGAHPSFTEYLTHADHHDPRAVPGALLFVLVHDRSLDRGLRLLRPTHARVAAALVEAEEAAQGRAGGHPLRGQAVHAVLPLRAGSCT